MNLLKREVSGGDIMKCPKCQVENREGARFCKECGTNLELACSGCGTVYEMGSKFCDKCGYSLAQESQIEKPDLTSDGERKHVTVLFSDLSGYTAMSERLDPEEVKEITGKLFNQISKVVAKYDGFIEKYAGDAVMVLFGADQSHEDDPVRAVKAALEIPAIFGEWPFFSEYRLIRKETWNDWIRKENVVKETHTFNNKSYQKMKLYCV